MTESKRCNDCGLDKPRSEFSTRKKGGFSNAYCKACMSKRAMAWAKKNKAKAAKHQRTYQKKHRDKLNQRERERYWSDPKFREKVREQKRRLYHKNK